jgi:hypothetical protein
MAVRSKTEARAVAEKKTVKAKTIKTSKRGSAVRVARAAVVAGEGFDSLLNAAVKELRQKGCKIAKALSEKSETGDIQSTKLLLALAGKKQAKKQSKRGSVALEIGSDPEWVGTPALKVDASEVDLETAQKPD